jgi:3-hydroxyisobutyrate dehydrogenase-like beta-hydroxyacid dehydrogenase
MSKHRIGWYGVGLMGHGAAKNILAAGYPLTVLGHRNREPVEDLLRQGAEEAVDPADLAAKSDIVFLCLPSTVEVEAAVYGAGGFLDAARAGLVLVDCSTSDPVSTRRIGADLALKGAAMLDAPLGRTPKEAELGKLSSFVGGEPAVLAKVKPVIATYAELIIETGPLGSGHTLKLVNNFIAIGTACVVAEGLATALRLGVDMPTLEQVVTSGGADSLMFRRFMPWILAGDSSHLKAPFRIVAKDLRYYARLAEAASGPALLANTASEMLRLIAALGHAEAYMPTMPGILAGLYGALPIHAQAGNASSTPGDYPPTEKP